MASRLAAAPVTAEDIITSRTIVPKDVIAKLGFAPTDNDGPWNAKVFAAIERIETDTSLSDRQKEDLHKLIELSPNPHHTAEVINRVTTDLFTAHLLWSAGFQVFLAGDRGDEIIDDREMSRDDKGCAPSTPREFRDTVNRRSGPRCELSGVTHKSGFSPEGARIFGLATSAYVQSDYFWDLLLLFWDSGVVAKLRNACRVYMNHMSNGIYMDCQAHALWDLRRYYLEVVKDSYKVSGNRAQYSVKIRFPWFTPDIINGRKPVVQEPDGRRYVHVLRDGDEIVLRTDHHGHCPLPDPNLLKIHALLIKCAFVNRRGEFEYGYRLNDLWQQKKVRPDSLDSDGSTESDE